MRFSDLDLFCRSAPRSLARREEKKMRIKLFYMCVQVFSLCDRFHIDDYFIALCVIRILIANQYY